MIAFADKDCAALVVWAMTLGLRVQCKYPASAEIEGHPLCDIHRRALRNRDVTVVGPRGELEEIYVRTEGYLEATG